MDGFDKESLAGAIAQAIIKALEIAVPEDNTPEMPTGSVPISVASAIYGKDANWIRAGIVAGWLPIGKAVRDNQQITKISQMDSKFGRITYYISPKKLYDDTGFIWRGEKTVEEIKERFKNEQLEKAQAV